MAIKIFRSSFARGDVSTNLKRLLSGPESHPGKKHIAQLLDRFELRGPNGHHLCLAFETLGPQVDGNHDRPDVTWEFAKQMVEAVGYAHEVGVVHGGRQADKSAGRLALILTWVSADLRRSRFLFPKTFDHLQGVEGRVIGDVQPVDSVGNVSPVLASSLTASVPRYVVAGLDHEQSIIKHLNMGFSEYEDSENQIKMIGTGCLESISVLKGLPYFAQYQAPELVLDDQLSPKADIWSLGCLVCHQTLYLDMYLNMLADCIKIFDLVVRRVLFDIERPSRDELIDAWVTILGPLPSDWSHHHQHPGSYDCLRKRQQSSFPEQRERRRRINGADSFQTRNRSGTYVEGYCVYAAMSSEVQNVGG